MYKVASITGSLEEPSSNFRIRQYFDLFNQLNITMQDFPSMAGKYPPKGIFKRVIWGFKILKERIYQVIKINNSNYDCIIIQREMISTLHTFEKFLKKPKILDVDDAIYLHRNGKFIKKIANDCNAIICGNSFLEDKFKDWNKNTFIIPSAVDTNKYTSPIHKKQSSDNIVIGWIGTSGGFKYIYKIEKALNHVISKYANVNLMIVSDSKPKFKLIKKFHFEKWTAKQEVRHLHEFDIGIMPLDNNEWSKGKCSYKMLQYMACGKPVVVSPVGMNNEVLQKAKIGFGAENILDWIKSLEILIKSQTTRIELGRNGRQVVEENYNLKTLAPIHSEIIKTIIRNNN